MSTAPTSSAHASTATAHTAPGKARHGAATENGGDLFANLLALLGSTHESATDSAPGTDNTAADEPADALKAQDPAADGSQNPLAALLGWTATPALPGAPVASTATANPSSTNVNVSSLNATTAPGLPGVADTTPPTTPLATPTLPAFTSTAAAPSTPALQGAAGTAATAAQPGVSLPGMAPLATPTAPDAQTLAALSRAAGGVAGGGAAGGAGETPAFEAPRNGPAAAEPAPGTPTTSAVAPAGDPAPAAPRSLHWRSTVGSTAANTTTASSTAATGHAPGAEATQSARQTLAAQSRSTVTLDERFGQANQAPLASDNGTPVAAGARGAPQPDNGSGTPGGAPGQSGLDATPESPVASSPEASAYAEATREPDDTGAAHWGTPNLRHASLRVGEAGEDAIDIQLSMAGQEVRVDFRTDNAEARASLAQDASGSLGELLQRSGIQLGSVSVGAQTQQQGEPGRAPVPAMPAQARNRTTADSETTKIAAPQVQRPRSDGSRPLDVFA